MGLFALRARRAVNPSDTIVLFSQRPATRKYCVRVNVPHGIHDSAIRPTMGIRFSKSNLRPSLWARSLCRILSTWPVWHTSRLIPSDGNLRSDARVMHFKTLIKNKRGNVTHKPIIYDRYAREPISPFFFPTSQAREIFYEFLGDIATVSFDIPESGRSLSYRETSYLIVIYCEIEKLRVIKQSENFYFEYGFH